MITKQCISSQWWASIKLEGGRYSTGILRALWGEEWLREPVHTVDSYFWNVTQIQRLVDLGILIRMHRTTEDAVYLSDYGKACVFQTTPFGAYLHIPLETED